MNNIAFIKYNDSLIKGQIKSFDVFSSIHGKYDYHICDYAIKYNRYKNLSLKNKDINITTVLINKVDINVKAIFYKDNDNMKLIKAKYKNRFYEYIIPGYICDINAGYDNKIYNSITDYVLQLKEIFLNIEDINLNKDVLVISSYKDSQKSIKTKPPALIYTGYRAFEFLQKYDDNNRILAATINTIFVQKNKDIQNYMFDFSVNNITYSCSINKDNEEIYDCNITDQKQFIVAINYFK